VTIPLVMRARRCRVDGTFTYLHGRIATLLLLPPLLILLLLRRGSAVHRGDGGNGRGGSPIGMLGRVVIRYGLGGRRGDGGGGHGIVVGGVDVFVVVVVIAIVISVAANGIVVVSGGCEGGGGGHGIVLLLLFGASVVIEQRARGGIKRGPGCGRRGKWRGANGGSGCGSRRAEACIERRKYGCGSRCKRGRWRSFIIIMLHGHDIVSDATIVIRNGRTPHESERLTGR